VVERTIGPYRVVGTIGQGGMGEVLLAEDDRLGRRVAIKTLPASVSQDAERRERFFREARAIAAHSHPSIVSIHDIGEDGGRIFLVLEYVEGRALSRVLREETLAVGRAVRLALQIVDALRASHRLGILHRDIKPDNVLVTARDEVKVLDFGLAKEVAGFGKELRGVESALTEAGVIVGSFPYMSPEQVLGEELDLRSDLFSFGIVFYEMLTGHRPFAGGTTPETLLSILYENPGKPAGGGAGGAVAAPDQRTAHILEKCLAKDRNARFASADELHVELEQLGFELTTTERRSGEASGSQGGTLPAAPPSPPRRTRTTAMITISRSKIRRIAAVAGTVIACGLLIWILVRPSQPAGSGPPQAIAVLPLTNIQNDPEGDYLGPSLAATITSRLSAVRSLVVRPSIYLEKYRGQKVDPMAAGRELGVEYLVTGHYLRRDERVQVSYELVRIRDRTALLERTFALPQSQVMKFPDEVAEEILRGLAVALSPEELERMHRNRPRSAEAYDLYLRALGLGADPNQSAAALSMVDQSIEKDPLFAPAWVERSRRYNDLLIYHFGTIEDRQKAIEAAEKALELDPKLGIAAAQLGNLLVDAGRTEEATEALRRGIENDPAVADLHHYLSYAYRFAGFLEESLQELDAADRVDPFRAKLNVTIRNPLLYLGRYQEFVDQMPIATTPIRHFYRGFALYHLGKKDEAAAAWDESSRIDPKGQFSLLGQSLRAAQEGRFSEGLVIVQDIVRKREQNKLWDGEVTYKLAQTAAQLGDLDLSEKLFGESVEQGFFCHPYFLRDPLLEPLRASGRAAASFEAAKKRHETFRARFFAGMKNGSSASSAASVKSR